AGLRKFQGVCSLERAADKTSKKNPTRTMMGLEPKRTKRWCKSQCDKSGDSDRDGDSDSELFVELPGCAADCGRRQEDCGQHQHDGNHWSGDFFHRAKSCVAGSAMTRRHVMLNGLDTHDNIV